MIGSRIRTCRGTWLAVTKTSHSTHKSVCGAGRKTIIVVVLKNLSVHSGKSSYLRYFLFTSSSIHLLDSYPVQPDKPFVLRKSPMNAAFQILHVRETNQFVHRGIVADVSLSGRDAHRAIRDSEAEHGNVQHIGFAGVDAGSLLWCDFCRDKVLFDSIGGCGNLFSTVLAWPPAQLRGPCSLRRWNSRLK